MRRSRLVERATTDEDDELDSWGSDDDDEDEEVDGDQSEVKEETKSLRNEDIGPDGSPEKESEKEPEKQADTKGKLICFNFSKNSIAFFSIGGKSGGSVHSK